MTHCDYCRHVDEPNSFSCQTCGYSLKNLAPKINPVVYTVMARGNGKAFERARRYLELIESGYEIRTVSKGDLGMTRKRLPFSLSDEAILAIDAIPHLTFETHYLGEFITKEEADHDILCEPGPNSDERLGASMHRPIRWQ